MHAYWHEGRIRAVILTAIVAVTVCISISVKAQDLDEYRRFREARFAEVHKANPLMEEQVAEVKADTAALLAAAPTALAPIDAPPAIWRVTSKLPFILDNPLVPRMVIVPAGDMTLGSPSSEAGRAPTDSPPHRVRIANAFAVGMFPVTFGEYSLYVAETRHVAAGACVLSRNRPSAARRDWRNPGFPQSFRSPAVCIASVDAQTYADWLSQKTGHRYRLLSEAEYEYVQRAGTTTPYWWGAEPAADCAPAVGRDAASDPIRPQQPRHVCVDAFRFTVEVGLTQPNGFGLFDVAGNIASWTADCWNSKPRGDLRNGSPNFRGNCRYRVVKGASWKSSDLRSAARRKMDRSVVSADLGFRVAREL